MKYSKNLENLTFFDKCSEESYYVLGWLNCFRKGTHFNIKTGLGNIEVVNYIKNNIFSSTNQKINIKNKNVSFNFISKNISLHCKQSAEYISSLVSGKNINNIVVNYYKGWFEALSTALQNDTLLIDTKVSHISQMLDSLKITYSASSNEFIIINTESTFNLLNKLYNQKLDSCFDFKSFLYHYFISLKKKYYDELKVEYVIVDSKDELEKTYITDAGIDISAVSIDKVIGNVIMLNTNVYMKIPVGYWGMLCPRSSIVKSGFMIANSFGVIDSSYRGELKVSLVYSGDVNEGFAKLKDLLPFKCSQIIFIKQTLPSMLNTLNIDNDSNNTSRGTGGHGSTK